jgi:hypothetical protein
MAFLHNNYKTQYYTMHTAEQEETESNGTNIDFKFDILDQKDPRMANHFMNEISKIVQLHAPEDGQELIINQEMIAEDIIRNCIIFPFQQFAPEIANFLNEKLINPTIPKEIEETAPIISNILNEILNDAKVAFQFQKVMIEMLNPANKNQSISLKISEKFKNIDPKITTFLNTIENDKEVDLQFKKFTSHINIFINKKIAKEKLGIQLQLPALKEMFLTLTQEIWKIPNRGEEIMRNLYPLLATSMMWYVWEIGSDNLALMSKDRSNFKIGHVIKEYDEVSTTLADCKISLNRAVKAVDNLENLDGLELETTEKVRNTFLPKGIVGELIKSLPRGFQNELAKLRFATWSKGSKDFVEDINKGLLKANIIAYDVALCGLNQAMRINIFKKSKKDPNYDWKTDEAHWSYQAAYHYSKRRYSEMDKLIDNPHVEIDQYEMESNDAITVGSNTILLPYSYFSLLLFFSAADENLSNFINSTDTSGLQDNYKKYIKTITEEVPIVSETQEKNGYHGKNTIEFVMDDTRSNREILTEMVMQISKIGRIGNDSIAAMTSEESLADLVFIMTEPQYEHLDHIETLKQYELDCQIDKNLRSLIEIEPMLRKDVLENEYNIALMAGILPDMTPDEKKYKFIENLGKMQRIYQATVEKFEHNLRLITLRSNSYEGSVIASSFSHFINWMLWERYRKGRDFDSDIVTEQEN